MHLRRWSHLIKKENQKAAFYFYVRVCSVLNKAEARKFCQRFYAALVIRLIFVTNLDMAEFLG